jgi:lysyl-tRNA synthetase class 1
MTFDYIPTREMSVTPISAEQIQLTVGELQRIVDASANLSQQSWVYREACGVLAHFIQRIQREKALPAQLLFETGYGPSGLPHIGTFGEVLRTIMVQHATRELLAQANADSRISELPVRLFSVSDDMDGMRKIPSTIPNPEQYTEFMDLPLVKIPDPFGTHASFGHHMNARLRAFLDTFGFSYEFVSASQCYAAGIFNDKLREALRQYEQIMAVMLPTLRDERRRTYSPFLPVCPHTGRVLQVPIVRYDIANYSVTYVDPETQAEITVPVTDGHCKLQWKPDFGMRWASFAVDFEMYGKDHLVNGAIYSRICEILGGTAPHQMFYELFLDKNGEKISKSKGNGFTIEEWLKYAPKESLSLFMYTSPQKAKKLYLEIVPQFVDDYLTYMHKYGAETDESKRKTNPVYHIHLGNPQPLNVPQGISYSLLLNLVSACNSEDSEIIWGYLSKFSGETVKKLKLSVFLREMVEGAMNYYVDFVKPYKKYRKATEKEVEAMRNLATELGALAEAEYTNVDALQQIVYDVGKAHELELRSWFQALYEVLLGASSGPRIGSFIAIYGVRDFVNLLNTVI